MLLLNMCGHVGFSFVFRRFRSSVVGLRARGARADARHHCFGGPGVARAGHEAALIASYWPGKRGQLAGRSKTLPERQWTPS